MSAAPSQALFSPNRGGSNWPRRYGFPGRDWRPSIGHSGQITESAPGAHLRATRGNQSIHVDFRLITATNRDLAQLMHDGRFREDLFYRLNVVRLELPPLRARRSDIPELAEHFLRRYGTERAGAPSGISDEALRALLLYDYPGNIRELENLIHQAVLLTRGPLLCLNDFPPTLGQSTSPGAEPQLRELLSMPLDQATRALERILITRAIVRSAGE